MGLASYDRLLKSWPELQIRITQLAREGSPPPGPRLLQIEVVKQFQSDSLRTDSPVRAATPATQSVCTAWRNWPLRFRDYPRLSKFFRHRSAVALMSPASPAGRQHLA